MSARMSKREMDEISKNSRVRFHGGDKQHDHHMLRAECAFTKLGDPSAADGTL